MFKYIVYIFAAIGFILVSVYAAVELGFTKTPGIIDNQHDYFKNQISSSTIETAYQNDQKKDDMAWAQGEEWGVLKEAITTDKADIIAASNKAEIDPRLIVASLIVEQLRLFHSDRELFKSVFAPLKILGNQSQFSWGVMGIKQDTAIQIENNLKDQTSVWYLGKDHEHDLDFGTSTIDSAKIDPDTERFDRLTDDKNRYFSYLYAAIYIKEIETQWEKAGISINDRPDVIATLFNIGFQNSHPHSDPQSGGAEIDIGTTTYSFGSLAGSFYSSNELTDIFPR
jgi:hypothetical protein